MVYIKHKHDLFFRLVLAQAGVMKSSFRNLSWTKAQPPPVSIVLPTKNLIHNHYCHYHAMHLPRTRNLLS